MLDDRPYMRSYGSSSYSSWNRNQRWDSVTVKILAICVLVFLIQMVVRSFFSIQAQNAFDQYLALSWDGISSGYIWQILTFQFMHGGILHILVNGLVIYTIGKPLEDDLGKKRFLQLYLLSGVAGGLAQVVGGRIAPGWIADLPTVGASAGAFGLLAAFGVLYAYRRITVLLFFIIPITLSARALLYGVLGFTVIMFFLDRPDGGDAVLVAHMAHLGGLVFGLIYTKQVAASGQTWKEALGLENLFNRGGSSWYERRQTNQWRKNVNRVRQQQSQNADSEESPLSPTEFISQKVDPILDKISKQGIQSLTEEERKILERAREWMANK